MTVQNTQEVESILNQYLVPPEECQEDDPEKEYHEMLKGDW